MASDEGSDAGALAVLQRAKDAYAGPQDATGVLARAKAAYAEAHPTGALESGANVLLRGPVSGALKGTQHLIGGGVDIARRGLLDQLQGAVEDLTGQYKTDAAKRRARAEETPPSQVIGAKQLGQVGEAIAPSPESIAGMPAAARGGYALTEGLGEMAPALAASVFGPEALTAAFALQSRGAAREEAAASGAPLSEQDAYTNLQTLLGGALAIGGPGEALLGRRAPFLERLARDVGHGALTGAGLTAATEAAQGATIEPGKQIDLGSVLEGAALMAAQSGLVGTARHLYELSKSEKGAGPSLPPAGQAAARPAGEAAPGAVELPEAAQAAFDAFRRASGAPRAEAVAPRPGAQEALESLLRDRGVTPIAVRDPEGKRLAAQGETSPDAKYVFYDSELPDAEVPGVMLGHELGQHVVETRNPADAQTWSELVAKYAPEALRSAHEDFLGRVETAMKPWTDATNAVKAARDVLKDAKLGTDEKAIQAAQQSLEAATLTAKQAWDASPKIKDPKKIAASEVPAYLKEDLGALAYVGRNHPEVLARIRLKNYGLWTKIVDSVRVVLRKLKLTDSLTALEQDIKFLEDQGARMPGGMSMDLAIDLANKLNEHIDRLIVPESERPGPLRLMTDAERAQRAATEPQAPEWVAGAEAPDLTAAPEQQDKKVMRALRVVAHRQTGYQGNKTEFFLQHLQLLAQLGRKHLADVEHVFDWYSGGGTYGMSYIASGLAPKAREITINEIDPIKFRKLELSIRDGGLLLDLWKSSPTLRGYLDELKTLQERTGVKGASPAGGVMRTNLGGKPVVDHIAVARKMQPAFDKLSLDEKAAVQAVFDETFAKGRTNNDLDKLIEAAAYDADEVRRLAGEIKNRGVKMNLVSMDAMGPEAQKRVREAGRSLVLLDPPYRGTSTATYAGDVDMGGREKLAANVAAARDMSDGNVVIYHNKDYVDEKSGAPEVIDSLKQHFGGKMAIEQWKRTSSESSKEVLGVFDGRDASADAGRQGAGVGQGEPEPGTAAAGRAAGDMGGAGEPAAGGAPAEGVGSADRPGYRQDYPLTVREGQPIGVKPSERVQRRIDIQRRSEGSQRTEPVQRVPAAEGEVRVGEEHPLRRAPAKAISELLTSETAHEAARTSEVLREAGWQPGKIARFKRLRDIGRASTDVQEQSVAHGMLEDMRRTLTPGQRERLEETQGRFTVDELRAAEQAAKADRQAWQIAQRGNTARAAEQVEKASAAWRDVGAQRRFSLAYHGSPHEFDKFSEDRIGTGEGAQAFGHGLYFTDRREIADFYKKNLARDHDAGGKLLNALTPEENKLLPRWVRGRLALAGEADDRGKSHGYLDDLRADWAKRAAEWHWNRENLKKIHETIEKVVAGGDFSSRDAGHVYEVELAPRADEYMRWDKPLSEQSQHVQERVGKAFGVTAYGEGGLLGEKFTGEEIYTRLANAIGVKAASKRLHDIGIRGIEYPAAQGMAEGAKNYVLFSDKDVEIKHRYSLPRPGKAEGDETLPEGKTLYHGTSAEPFGRFRGPVAYFTTDPKEAMPFATDPFLRKGTGTPRVAEVKLPKDSHVRDVSERVLEAVMEGDDVDKVIANLASDARGDGYDFVKFEHPSGYSTDDFIAYVSTDPTQFVSPSGAFSLPRMTPGRVARITEGAQEALDNPDAREAFPVRTPSTGERAGAFQQGVGMEQRRGLETVPLEHMAAQAQAELEHDRPGTERRLQAKLEAGGHLDEWEHIAVAQVAEDKTQAMLRRPSPDNFLEATRWAWMDREAGTRAGRDLAARKYRAERYGLNAITAAVAEPSKYLKAKMRAMQDRIDRETDPEARFSLQKQMDALMQEAAGQNSAAVAALSRRGLDPSLVSADYYKDPYTFHLSSRIIAEAKTKGVERAWNWLMQYRLAAMLSAPTTHLANVLGNVAHLIYEGPAKKFAEATANIVLRDKGAATYGELYSYIRAYLPGLAHAARNFVAAMRTDRPSFEAELERRGILKRGDSSSRLSIEGHAPVGGKVGRVLRFPSLTLLTAEDEFFKTLAAHTEAVAQAHRMTGGDLARMEALLQAPESPVWQKGLEHARKATFQDRPNKEDEPFVHWALHDFINKGRESIAIGPVKPLYLVLPFTSTPFRIMQRGLAVPFHPLVMLAKGVRTMMGDKGGYQGKPGAFARDVGTLGLSMGIAYAVSELVHKRDEEGQDGLPFITGSRPWNTAEKAFQARTAPAYSVRVGDEYYSYGRLDPAATALGALVDAAEAYRTAAHSKDEDATTKAALRLFSSGYDMTKDKTFLRTLGDVMEALRAPEGAKAARLVRDTLVTPMVPNILRRGLAAGEEAQTSDNVRPHEGESAWPSALRSVPGAALPGTGEPQLRYDVWGREVQANGRSGLARFLSPAPITGRVQDIADLDMVLQRYNDRVDRGEMPPDAKKWYPDAPEPTYLDVKGQKHYFSDEQFARFQRDAGRRAFEMASRLEVHNPPTEQDKNNIERAVTVARRLTRLEIAKEQ